MDQNDIERAADYAKTLELIEKMAPMYKHALVLVLIEGLNPNAAGVELGLTREQVLSRVRKGSALLKAVMSKPVRQTYREQYLGWDRHANNIFTKMEQYLGWDRHAI